MSPFYADRAGVGCSLYNDVWSADRTLWATREFMCLCRERLELLEYVDKGHVAARLDDTRKPAPERWTAQLDKETFWFLECCLDQDTALYNKFVKLETRALMLRTRASRRTWEPLLLDVRELYDNRAYVLSLAELMNHPGVKMTELEAQFAEAGYTLAATEEVVVFENVRETPFGFVPASCCMRPHGTMLIIPADLFPSVIACIFTKLHTQTKRRLSFQKDDLADYSIPFAALIGRFREIFGAPQGIPHGPDCLEEVPLWTFPPCAAKPLLQMRKDGYLAGSGRTQLVRFLRSVGVSETRCVEELQKAFLKRYSGKSKSFHSIATDVGVVYQSDRAEDRDITCAQIQEDVRRAGYFNGCPFVWMKPNECAKMLGSAYDGFVANKTELAQLGEPKRVCDALAQLVCKTDETIVRPREWWELCAQEAARTQELTDIEEFI